MSLGWLLKTFKDEDKVVFDKGEISLTGVLQRKRLKLSREKGPRKASTHFNPYALAYGFCMREKVAQLCGWHDIWIKPPTPKEQLIFDIGHKYHDIIQGYFWKCGILEGDWACKHCYYKWWARSPKTCPQCNLKLIKYAEVPLENAQYHVRGRSDGIVWLEIDKAERDDLMDVKSISNRGRADTSQDPRRYFEDLEESGPVEHHIVQLQSYLWMANKLNGHLLYVAKNGHQMKSFHIKRNESILRPYLDKIREALDWSNDLKEGKRQELPPVCELKKCECEKIVKP